MRVILLSPGPSLSHFDPAIINERDRGDVVIAINRAASAFACDWWAALDSKALDIITPLGSPALLTAGKANRQPDWYTARGFPEVRFTRHLKVDAPRGWNNWTCPSALVFAVHLGAKQIDCYGVDMAGSAYFNGATNCRVNEKRWAKERPIWDAVSVWAAGRGVEITRHLQFTRHTHCAGAAA